jgi:DNA-binding CsgD family transcriptional regulator
MNMGGGTVTANPGGVHEPAVQWPFAGRGRELEDCVSLWADSLCKGLFIFGPRGVGKTRLADNVLARVAGRRWKVTRVTATTAAARVPLGAVAHMIPAGTDMSDPVNGFAVVAESLSGRTYRRRRVVVVDDLHLLDAASTVLLRQLLDAGVVRLIGTVQSAAALSDAVGTLTRGEGMRRIDLTAFDVQQCEQVLHAALGAPTSQRTLHKLHSSSGGNALYLRELVEGSLADGALRYTGEVWELLKGALPATPRLSELIGARLAAAPAAARQVLDLLAVCERLPLTDAQSVVSAEALADLESAGLIQGLTDRSRISVVLAHPLYGEVLRAELPGPRRRELLLAQAARIEAHGGRRREDALCLATWYLAATGTADPALLVRAAAVARHAHDYRLACSLLEAVPEQHRTHAIDLGHGFAAMQAGDWKQADALLARAQARARQETESVAATVVRTWNLFCVAGRADDALRVNEAAYGEVHGDEERQALVFNEAALLTVSGRPAEGLTVLDSLESDVARTPTRGVWSVAAMARTAGLAYAGRASEAITWGQKAYAAHMAMDEQELSARGTPAVAQLNPVIFALSDAGRLAEAREVADQVLEGAVHADAALSRVWGACSRGRTEWLAGDAAAARRWYVEALALARSHHYSGPLSNALAGLTASAALLGDLPTAEKALAEMADHPLSADRVGEEALGEAWLHAARGHLDLARTVLSKAAGRARDSGHLSSEMLVLTDVARLGGAKDVAARLAELSRMCDGPFAPARACLAAGLAAESPEQLMSAAEELRVIGAYLLAAEAASTAASLWCRSGQLRRATAATRLAHSSVALCPGVRTPLLVSTDVADPLSPREREVALLAAAGASSKDIATVLQLSVRTVDNHLLHVYAKLGISARRELASALRRDEALSVK